MRIRGGGADEGAWRNNVLDALDLDLEYNDEGNQIIVLLSPLLFVVLPTGQSLLLPL